MKALVYKAKNAPLAFEEMKLPEPTKEQAVVNLKSAALNHRDNWITKGLYPNIREDIILGSDGAGTVDGREVIINPNIGWGSDERFPSPDYLILGMPTHGTFAEQICIAKDRLVDKPAHLSMEEAAALPLGGLTAYRTLFSRCATQAGDNVLISGVGGGVALFACQFAIAAGAKVWVTSGSEEKIDKAVALGASGGVSYRQDGWAKQIKKQSGGFDVIIDSAGGQGFADLVKVTRPGARIGLYGGTRGNWEGVSPPIVFFNQIDILGSTMGSDKDFADMVAFVNKHKIKPVIDANFLLADGNAALSRMDNGEQFGKITLTIGA
ncbi:MAG: zinc-binding dehydrogenase [Burkholderiaceae bacterium]